MDVDAAVVDLSVRYVLYPTSMFNLNLDYILPILELININERLEHLDFVKF